jgi:hypothetical protein
MFSPQAAAITTRSVCCIQLSGRCQYCPQFQPHSALEVRSVMCFCHIQPPVSCHYYLQYLLHSALRKLPVLPTVSATFSPRAICNVNSFSCIKPLDSSHYYLQHLSHSALRKLPVCPQFQPYSALRQLPVLPKVSVILSPQSAATISATFICSIRAYYREVVSLYC